MDSTSALEAGQVRSSSGVSDRRPELADGHRSEHAQAGDSPDTTQLSLISVCKRGNGVPDGGSTEERIARFGEWKRTSEASVQVGLELGIRGHRIMDQARCATHLVFHEYLADVGRPAKSRLAEVYCCSSWKTCILCAHRRAALALNRYVPRILFQRLQDRRSRVFMVELGIRDGERLGERLRALERGWQGLRQAAYNARRGKSSSIFGQILGAVAQVEVIRGKNSGEWHPHIHAAMIFDRDWLDVEAFGAAWSEAVNEGYRAWTHVQKCYAERLIPIGSDDLPEDYSGWETRLYRDCCEVLKYPTKLERTNPQTLEDAWFLAEHTCGTRFLRALGCLRHKGDTDIEAGPDPDGDGDREPVAIRRFRWRRALERYVEALEAVETK